MEAVMIKDDKSFVEEAYENLRQMRREILDRFPGSTYLRQRHGVSDAMQVELPEDNIGERIY